MTGLLFTLALFAPLQSSTGEDVEQPRAYHEISKEMRQWMTRESRAKSMKDRGVAVRAIAEIYLELKRDPRLVESPTLQQYKGKIWSRLTRIRKDLQRQIDREKPNSNLQNNEFDTKQLALEDANRTTESLAAQMSLVGSSLGGPSKVFADASRGAFGGGARDDGAALVELITRVIDPDFWDVNGGPGSIFYYAPLHALVIRATSEVHYKIGGGLGGIRAAGP